MDLQISKLNNVIINKDYEQTFDANDVFNIQGIRATGELTTNLPSEVSGESCYGILHTYLDDDGDGYQQYIPLNGVWKNTFFKRRIRSSNNSIGDWQYLLDSSEWTEELVTDSNEILGAINEIATLMGIGKDITFGNFESLVDAINYSVSYIGYASDLILGDEGVNNCVDAINDVAEIAVSNKNRLDILEQGPDLSDISFDTFSTIDNTTEGCTSSGVLTTDLMASNGKAYSLTTATTSKNVFTAEFSDVKFGKYALCMRVRVSANTSSSAILNVNMLNGSTNILSKNILGTNFDSNTKYCYICTTFDYEGSSSTAKQPLIFSLYSTNVSGITVYFDYAYISLLTPAVYI